ncbi:MAG: AI-2E family transporter [Zoogloea sp.]|nr:AI-2E family transporter [Zoogloea sp.]
MADSRDKRTEVRDAPREGQHRLVREFALFYGVGAVFAVLAALVLLASNALLLIFAGILLAVLLDDACSGLQKHLHLPRGLVLGMVLLLTVGVLGVAGWQMAPGVLQQANELFDALPRSLEHLQSSMRRYGVLESMVGKLPSADTMASQASSMLERARLFFSGVFGSIAGAVVVVFIAIYLAARPDIYIDGVLTLVPPARRRRAREILDEMGRTLAHWLRGKLLSMVIIGVLTASALALLQVPLALVLGIMAGLLDFIPYLGPIMASVPAVLIAFSDSPTLALYVVLLFIAMHGVEGYLVLPLIERRTVSLPPALILVMQVLFGTLFGLVGIALATPLTAVLTVLITMLYVQDELGEEVKVPSEH